MNHEQSKDILSHRQLLRDFGAHEGLADDMLNDQGKHFLYPFLFAICAF